MLVYLAGLYSVGDVDENIAKARVVAAKLWDEGVSVICPHANTGHFESLCVKAKYEDFMAGDFDMIRRCDAIVMMTGWENSPGANREHSLALLLRIPVYYWPNYPSRHPTEISSPQQCQSFLEIIMSMYRVHLDKNADYSPANILGTGEVGLVTRLWDKCARLMNLTGFRMTIESSSFEAPRVPKSESIDDSYLDLAVYAIIGLLLRRGQWGK